MVYKMLKREMLRLAAQNGRDNVSRSQEFRLYRDIVHTMISDRERG